MKKYITALCLVAWIGMAAACDVCGCAAGGGYNMGILPRFNKHFVGVRYSYTSFTSQHLALFEGEKPQHSAEYFTTATLWGRYVPHKRVQLFAFVPYNYNVRNENGINTMVQGWGDATLMGSYVVFNTTDSLKRKLRHSLQASAGVKLPTGASNRQSNSSTLQNVNMQPGSGSWDFPISLLYTLRKNNVGINAEAGHTLTRPNARGYWFGDKFNSALKVFYWKKYRNTNFLPQAGLAFEHRSKDWDGADFLDYTGGKMLSLTAAIDVYFYKYALAFGVQQPISHTLGGGNINPKTRLNASIIYLF